MSSVGGALHTCQGRDCHVGNLQFGLISMIIHCAAKCARRQFKLLTEQGGDVPPTPHLRPYSSYA